MHRRVCPGLPRSAPGLPRVCPGLPRVCPASALCLPRSAPRLPRVCPVSAPFCPVSAPVCPIRLQISVMCRRRMTVTLTNHSHCHQRLSAAIHFFPSAARTHWQKCLDHGLVPYWGRVCRIDPLTAVCFGFLGGVNFRKLRRRMTVWSWTTNCNRSMASIWFFHGCTWCCSLNKYIQYMYNIYIYFSVWFHCQILSVVLAPLFLRILLVSYRWFLLFLRRGGSLPK